MSLQLSGIAILVENCKLDLRNRVDVLLIGKQLLLDLVQLEFKHIADGVFLFRLYGLVDRVLGVEVSLLGSRTLQAVHCLHWHIEFLANTSHNSFENVLRLVA